MNAFKGLTLLVKKLNRLLTFEKRLSRRNKIILGIFVFSMWLAIPMSMKIMILSTHCINLGLGLFLHGMLFYRKRKTVVGFNLNLNRHMTVALGTTLFLCGVISRRVIL